MEIPGNWISAKRQRPTRSRGDVVRKKSRCTYEKTDSVSLDEMCSTICQNVLDARRQVVEDSLNFENIITSIPYRQILETLFTGSAMVSADVPIVTKSIEESYMREPVMHGERKCVMGNECECKFIDRDNAFVAVEFLVGSQTVTNCEPQMCVMCSRKHTQRLYYELIFKPPMTHFGVIQRYGVLSGVQNEYTPEHVLIMPPNGPIEAMPYPSPIHCRNNYKVVVRLATRYIVQKANSAFQMPSLAQP